MSIASDLATATETFGAAYAAAMAANPRFENLAGIHVLITRRLAALNAAAIVARVGRTKPVGPLPTSGELVSELTRLLP